MLSRPSAKSGSGFDTPPPNARDGGGGGGAGSSGAPILRRQRRRNPGRRRHQRAGRQDPPATPASRSTATQRPSRRRSASARAHRRTATESSARRTRARSAPTAAPAAGQWGFLPKFGSASCRAKAARSASSAPATRASTTTERDLGQLDTAPGSVLRGARDIVGQPLNYPSAPMVRLQHGRAAPPGFPKAAAGCQQDNVVNDMIDVKLVTQGADGRERVQVRLRLLLERVAELRLLELQRRIRRVSHVGEDHRQHLVRREGQPGRSQQRLLESLHARRLLGCNRTDLDVPDSPLSTSTCAGGAGELDGTGYATQAQTRRGTRWASALRATPLQEGAIRWSTDPRVDDLGCGDGILDSTVPIDHFQWIGGTPAVPGTQRPPK